MTASLPKDSKQVVLQSQHGIGPAFHKILLEQFGELLFVGQFQVGRIADLRKGD